MITEGRRRASWWPSAALAALAAVAAAAGCGEADEPPDTVRQGAKLDDVPEAVLKAAQARLPGVRFDDAWKNVGPDGSLRSYELRGRASGGKIREVRVGLNGAILEEE